MDFVLDPSLVLYLPLHKLDGDSIRSEDAHGHLCAASGVWQPDGRLLNGVDERVDVPTNTAFDTPDGVTMEVWCNRSAVAANAGLFGSGTRWTIRSGGIANEQYHLLIYVDGGWQSGGYSVSLPLSRWSHLLYTYDSFSGRALLYTNGVRDSITLLSGLGTYKVGVGAAPVHVGYDPLNGVFCTGIIGEARIYNRALSHQEVLRNYIATKWRYR